MFFSFFVRLGLFVFISFWCFNLYASVSFHYIRLLCLGLLCFMLICSFPLLLFCFFSLVFDLFCFVVLQQSLQAVCCNNLRNRISLKWNILKEPVHIKVNRWLSVSNLMQQLQISLPPIIDKRNKLAYEMLNHPYHFSLSIAMKSFCCDHIFCSVPKTKKF